MPKDRMVYAVITSHMDCSEYIYQDCINISSYILPGLERAAAIEDGQVELMTQAIADKLFAKYAKRYEKIQKAKLKERKNGGTSEPGRTATA